MTRRRRLSIGRAGALGLTLVALLLGLAQLLLPRIASRVLRDRVASYGEVQSASVSALPAVELLWGRADSARLVLGRVRVSPRQLVGLLVESKPVTEVNVSADEVDLLHSGFGAGTVSLQRVRLHKRGESLYASALLSSAALRKALPRGTQVAFGASEGDGVEVLASGQLFGFKATVSGLVHVAEGKLLLTPSQPMLAGLAKVTLFADARVQLESVAATLRSGAGQQAVWLLHLRARLR